MSQKRHKILYNQAGINFAATIFQPSAAWYPLLCYSLINSKSDSESKSGLEFQFHGMLCSTKTIEFTRLKKCKIKENFSGFFYH